MLRGTAKGEAAASQLGTYGHARPVSQEDVVAVYRSVLKREPESQAAIDKVVGRNVDLRTLIAEMLCSQEYLKTLPDPVPAYVPPPIPLLVPPRRVPASGETRVAVLVRSHVIDEKFEHLWRDLNGEGRRFDAFPLLDQSALGADLERIERTYPNVIWNHPDQLPELGLSQKTIDNIFWLCGDLSLDVAFVRFPQYDYYIMIDYDVHFTKGATEYVNRLCDRLLSSDEEVVDGVGLEFKSRPTLPGVTTDWPNFMDWSFFAAAAEVFPQVYHFYFPLVALSRRAVLQVFAQRHLEAARRTPPDKVVICEAFVPSNLMAAGLKCMDLNTLLPGSYELDSMGLQHLRSDRLAGQPLSYAIRHPQPGVEMVHAVYSQEKFLERNLNQRSGSRAELEWFSTELIETFAPTLQADLLEDYLSRARERMASF